MDGQESPFGTSCFLPSTNVFHPPQKPIECPLLSMKIHCCLPVLLSVLLSKVTERMQGVSVFPRACARRKKSHNLCWLRLFLYSRMTTGTLASRHFAYVAVDDQGQWCYTSVCAARSCFRCSGEDSRGTAIH